MMSPAFSCFLTADAGTTDTTFPPIAVSISVDWIPSHPSMYRVQYYNRDKLRYLRQKRER